jgi:hypothetical protein
MKVGGNIRSAFFTNMNKEGATLNYATIKSTPAFNYDFMGGKKRFLSRPK